MYCKQRDHAGNFTSNLQGQETLKRLSIVFGFYARGALSIFLNFKRFYNSFSAAVFFLHLIPHTAFAGFYLIWNLGKVSGIPDFIGTLSVNHLFSIIHRRMNLGGPWLTFRQLLALTKGCIIADCWRRVWRGR